MNREASICGVEYSRANPEKLVETGEDDGKRVDKSAEDAASQCLIRARAISSFGNTYDVDWKAGARGVDEGAGVILPVGQTREDQMESFEEEFETRRSEWMSHKAELDSCPCNMDRTAVSMN